MICERQPRDSHKIWSRELICVQRIWAALSQLLCMWSIRLFIDSTSPSFPWLEWHSVVSSRGQRTATMTTARIASNTATAHHFINNQNNYSELITQTNNIEHWSKQIIHTDIPVKNDDIPEANDVLRWSLNLLIGTAALWTNENSLHCGHYQ